MEGEFKGEREHTLTCTHRRIRLVSPGIFALDAERTVAENPRDLRHRVINIHLRDRYLCGSCVHTGGM